MKFDNRFFIIVIAAVGLYAIFFIVSDFAIVSTQITSFKIQFLPIIITLVPCSWLALYARWNLLLRNVNVKIPLKQNLKIYFGGYALAITPGKFGELVKSQLLKSKFNVPYTTTAPLVLVERLYDMVGAVAAAMFGIWLLGIGSVVIIVASSMLVLFFVLISSRNIFNKFLKIFGKFKIMSKILLPLSESYEVVRASSRGKIAILASLLTLSYWLLESLAVYFVLLAFGIDSVTYFNVVSTYTTSLILGAASFIPGGIGVAEGSLVGLLGLQGMDVSSTLTPVVIIRIVTLWYSVVVGFIALKLSGGFSLKAKS